MSQHVLVDTDILIDMSRNVPEAIDCIIQLENRFGIAISTITEMELIVGCRNKNELRIVERLIAQFSIIRLNEPISHEASTLLKHYYLSHGLLIPDALIAATAIFQKIPLASKNQRDYRFIDDLNLLPYPNPL